MILFLQTVAEKTAEDPNIIDQLTKILEVIIWPLTVVGALLLFRKNFKHILSRVDNFKVGPTGLEMTLLQQKMKEASPLFPTKSPLLLAKDGGGIIPKDGGGIIPKDGGSITPKTSETETRYQTSHADTPYLELLELQEAINQKLKSIEAQSEITNTGTSNIALTSNLEKHNIIKGQTAQQLKKLIELIGIGLNTPQITYDQVIQMKRMFINISF